MTLQDTSNSHILIVDDDPYARQILRDSLELVNYRTTDAVNGEQALTILHENPDQFDAVLLDIQMPILTGWDVLKKMKQDRDLQHIPVIMQTGVSENESILEGFRMGAFHYLVKPISIELVSSVIASAISNNNLYSDLKQEILEHNSAIRLLGDGTFYFQTMTEAQSLARLIAKACTNPEKVVIGLAELLFNAIEHGNLGISYEEKGTLLEDGLFSEEIEKRLKLTENKSKKASVQICQREDGQYLIIKDKGNGFNWRKYYDLDISRLSHNHGRGILIAQKLSFTSLTFIEPGNEVHAFVSSD